MARMLGAAPSHQQALPECGESPGPDRPITRERRGDFPMLRKLAPALLAALLMTGCAGPAKLAERSEEKLAGGDMWRAWHLAIQALDKQPGNPRARAAATAAGTSIGADWQRRILALADVDSVNAADQVLEYLEFRAQSARYATIGVTADWSARETTLRLAAARLHYQRGATALSSGRPKLANLHFSEVERFAPGYRDAAALVNRTFEKALARLVVVPFRASSDLPALGTQVAQSWRDDLVRTLIPPRTRFTRILGSEVAENAMTVSQLGSVSRDEAVRLGRKAGAQRVVWGSIGGIHSETRLDLFRDVVSRRVVDRGADGRERVTWVDVPIEVVARVRDVTVGVEYEVISTNNGATLARDRCDRSTSARVVWTSYQPEGASDTYSLVSEEVRAANPARTKAVETRWKLVCGEGTTLAQVLTARRGSGSTARYTRSSLPRFIEGAAFVFLEDLPPADDLAFAALAHGSGQLAADLARLDGVDDVDLGLEVMPAVTR